jgi:hypothetical protein
VNTSVLPSNGIVADIRSSVIELMLAEMPFMSNNVVADSRFEPSTSMPPVSNSTSGLIEVMIGSI